MRIFQGAAGDRVSRRRLRAAVAGAAAAGLVVGTTALSASAASGQAPRVGGLTAKHPVVTAGAQHAAMRYQPRRGRILGILPSQNQHAAVPATANGTPPLTYHGGPVQHSSKVYAIFWQPPGYYLPPAYRAAVAQYFKDVSGDSYRTSNVYAASTQYYDRSGPGGRKNWVSYDISYGGSTLLRRSLPSNGCANYTLGDLSTTRHCLVDAQIQTVISNVISAHHWKSGLGAQAFLFTPPGLGECIDSNPGDGCYDPYYTSGYCAYHSTLGSSTRLYAFQPFTDLPGCQYSVPDGPYPNDDGADTVINVVSHEQNETMTDPLGNAWWDSSGYENGDECAWLSLTTHYNGIGDYSQTIQRDQYLMQYEWSNRVAGCVARNTSPQPGGSFSVTASGVRHGKRYTAHASDSDDSAFTYRWSFGDGTSKLTTSAKVSHTYARAGRYKVTLVIFDAHGDQVRLIKKVRVF